MKEMLARRKYEDTKIGGDGELTAHHANDNEGEGDQEIQPLSSGSGSNSPTTIDTIQKRHFRNKSLPRILMFGCGIAVLVLASVLILKHQSGGIGAGNTTTSSNNNGSGNSSGNNNNGDIESSKPVSNDAGHQTGTNGSDDEYKQIPAIISTNSPTKGPTILPTQLPTKSPTIAPEAATVSPTISATAIATFVTEGPTTSPTKSPTAKPTTRPPTAAPTTSPTTHLTISPTLSPTTHPTILSTLSPTIHPTISPTLSPTLSPTTYETKAPIPSVTLADGIMYDLQSDVPLYHDKTHFTQGLTYSKKSDILFESNGLYRQSSLCRLNPTTGEELLCKPIETNLFAEGMQVYTNITDNDTDTDNERLIQITWKARRGFIYDASTLERIHEFTFSTTRNEGWGICYDEANNEFIVSDGSNVLHFWDGITLEEKRRVEVYRQSGSKANDMNELEFVNGKVLANVWYQDVILVIDPVSGDCESEYDFSQLWPQIERRRFGADVLNGISITKDDGILYITGKKWNRMYKVKLRNF